MCSILIIVLRYMSTETAMNNCYESQSSLSLLSMSRSVRSVVQTYHRSFVEADWWYVFFIMDISLLWSYFTVKKYYCGEDFIFATTQSLLLSHSPSFFRRYFAASDLINNTAVAPTTSKDVISCQFKVI